MIQNIAIIGQIASTLSSTLKYLCQADMLHILTWLLFDTAPIAFKQVPYHQ